MKRKNASYSLEFKLQAIAMVKEGRQTAADIARSLGVPKSIEPTSHHTPPSSFIKDIAFDSERIVLE
jgi:hypothetical protein